MKLNQFKTSFFLVLMVSSFLFLPISSHAALDESEYIVQNLQVNDIPNDDGTGLVLSWKPLPKEKRIIEYRIYRGVTPDSLFYIGRIDVNVKTGVAGDLMYFYDTAYNYFLDIQAPGKLKKEKKQAKDSPLYRRYPRDLAVTGPQFENYSILTVIPEKDYYYKNRKIEVVAEEDTTVYAALKLRNFRQLAKKLLDNKEYYYTVFAVNEARKYFPHAEPVMGIPRENAPEETKEFYPVFVKDINRLQFEWSLPIFTDDIYYHCLYVLDKDELDKFQEYTNELKIIEKNNLSMKLDSTVVKYEPKLENPAELIFMRYGGYPYTGSKTVHLDIVDGKIKSEKIYKNEVLGQEFDVDIEIDIDKIQDYYFVFSLFDTSNYETFSEVKAVEILYTDMLPEIPAFTVVDGKNDKGDYNYVSWGKPVVYLTNSSYLNEEKTKLLVNYDTMTNENYKIRNIYFTVYDDAGNEIKKINEFYQDKKLIIKIPPNTESLKFEITLKCNNPIGENYSFYQDISWDDKTKSLSPGVLYFSDNKEDIHKYSYYIYKRNYTDEEFRLSKKITGSQRELYDNIRYKNVHFKITTKFDADKGLIYVSPAFSVRMDDEQENTIRSNLYPSEVERTLKGYKEQIADHTASKDTLKTEEEIKDADDAIEHYQNLFDLLANHPISKEAASFSNPKTRIKYLDKSRHIAKNSFEYKIVKSDDKGHFNETPIYINEDAKPVDVEKNIALISYEGFGRDHFFPIPNWFKTTMFPALLATLIFGGLVFIMIGRAKKGHDLFVRPIAGIEEIDNAIGRATEMGKPILFVPGTSGITDVATLAGLSILGRVAKKAAEYDTKILVPCRDYLVLPVAQEIVKEAHYEAGRPDSYDKTSVFFITTAQFPFVAGVNGIMVREKTATNFFMGMFWAEALLMTETGNITGAIQIAGTDAATQLPFFITTCDYTLIGEELYAASAYLAREPKQLGTLKGVDYTKLLILLLIISGTILSSVHLTFLMNAFPEK